MSLRNRFASKFDRRGPDECWPWTGARTQAGYGRILVPGKRHATTAHRVAYELEVGPIPEGHFVLHRCDNPRCVNPAHLFTGTHADNMDDMVRKGRSHSPALKGERHGRSRLREDEVLQIRAAAHRHGWGGKRLARHFRVSVTLAESALTHWRHLDHILPPPKRA